MKSSTEIIMLVFVAHLVKKIMNHKKEQENLKITLL